MPTPRHIAIIMDGNGRWAEARQVARLKGHRQGAEALREIVRACAEHKDIAYLTLYAFSTENWKRSPEEVADLMNLLRHYVKSEAKAFAKNGMSLRFIGDRATLPADIRADLAQVEHDTQGGEALSVIIALSYGARQEITQAARALAARVADGALEPAGITESVLEEALYTHDMPDPDLLIRTGGERRLSNFLLWQSAYAELYFSDILWPDFTPEHLADALRWYAQRERRFGARHE